MYIYYIVFSLLDRHCLRNTSSAVHYNTFLPLLVTYNFGDTVPSPAWTRPSIAGTQGY